MLSWSILGGCWGAEGFWNGSRNPLLSWYFSSTVVLRLFGTRDWFCGRQFFYGLGWEGWFWDDSHALHLLCTLFLLLLHQLQLKSSVVRSGGLRPPTLMRGLPRWLSGKNPPANAGDAGSIPRSGISPGGGHGNPLQYSCLENSMDRGAWQATVYGVAKSWTRLSMQSLMGSPKGHAYCWQEWLGRNLFGTFSSVPVSCWTREMCGELLEGPFSFRWKRTKFWHCILWLSLQWHKWS